MRSWTTSTGSGGVRRLAGAKSRVPGTLTGTSGATIAAGVIVQGGGTDGSARWVSLESVTLTGGTAAVTWQAEEAGATNVDAGTALIVTPRAGLDSATFGSPVTLGSTREDDAAYRLRGALSVGAPGAHTLGAMLAAVLAVDGVTDAFVVDNPDNATQTIHGISLAAHRTIVYVLPNPLDSTAQTAVLDAIAANFTLGIQTAATGVTRTEADAATGASYTVGFDYGTELAAAVVATLTLASGFALADAKTSLQTAIEAHVATLNMGDALRLITLCGLAAGISGINGATFTINALSQDLEPAANQAITSATVAAVSA